MDNKVGGGNMATMAKQKERRAWLYLNEADDEVLAKMDHNMGGKIPEAALLSVVVSAALKAYREAGSKMPTPLKAEPESTGVRYLNEPKEPKSRR
jgi:hypothetical protein